MNTQANKSESGALPELIRELMAKYDAFRGMWVEEFGSADGFDTWFTQQALKGKKSSSVSPSLEK